MKKTLGLFWNRLGKNLRKQFLAGIIAVIPIGITTLILVWIFNNVDNMLQPMIKPILGKPMPPGVGFGATIILIYLVGAIASGIGGKAITGFVDTMVGRVPIVRLVYNGTKQILESFSAPGKTGFMQVVLLEFPRKGMRTLGFITNESSTENGKKLLNVFVPTAPNPTSGFLQIVEESEVVRTKMKVDDALKMVVSAGRMSFPEISERLSKDN